jgi:hypothetical protein
VFSACGGTHDDWDTYDRVMREEGRVAVLVAPTGSTATPERAPHGLPGGAARSPGRTPDALRPSEPVAAVARHLLAQPASAAPVNTSR